MGLKIHLFSHISIRLSQHLHLDILQVPFFHFPPKSKDGGFTAIIASHDQQATQDAFGALKNISWIDSETGTFYILFSRVLILIKHYLL